VSPRGLGPGGSLPGARHWRFTWSSTSISVPGAIRGEMPPEAFVSTSAFAPSAAKRRTIRVTSSAVYPS